MSRYIFKEYTGTVIDISEVKDVLNIRLRFSIPLDHWSNKSSLIDVCGVLTQRVTADSPFHGSSRISALRNVNNRRVCKIGDSIEAAMPQNPKVMLFLQGGPGFPCKTPTAGDAITKTLLDEGYQIFYLDQRGTGYSTPIDVHGLPKDVPTAAQYLLKFRADSIIEDCEYIRRSMQIEKWSVLGQSYGGFCIFTYLSRYSESLDKALITGGIPPVGHHPDDVYTKTYMRTKERNIHFYRKYPQDISKVHKIAKHLHANNVKLPNGGTLSVERFQSLGLSFGATGSTDAIHELISKLDWDLECKGQFSYSSLVEVQNFYSFDTNPLYFLFQEAIYQDGISKASNWSADRLRYKPENWNFVYDKVNAKILQNELEPLYFTGEMVYKSMLEDYSELKSLKEVAEWLHSYEDWSELYDKEKLSQIDWHDVPIVAATYVHDQYVDFLLSSEVKVELFKTGNLRQYITSEFFHNGLRSNPEKVLGELFRLLNSEID